MISDAPINRRFGWLSFARQPSIRIVAGLIAGLLVGALFGGTQNETLVLDLTTPVGKLWLDALTMTVVPLVSALLISGVFEAGAYQGNVIARRAFVWFAVLLVLASAVGGLVAMGILEFWPIPTQASALVIGQGPDVVAPNADWLSSIVPTNIIKAASESAMVSIVLFALLFGFALTRIDQELGNGVASFFKGVAQVMLVIVKWVLWLAPVGVFALAIGVGSRLGAGAASILLHYIIVIVSVCLIVTLAMYIIAVVFSKVRPVAFAKSVFPAQAIAVTTQSSLASLPAMVAAASPLRVDAANAGIILPLAVSVFRAASAAANVGVAVYLAQWHGVLITPETFIVGALVAAAVSVGAVGLPAQVSFFAVIAPVCIAMGVPVTLLPILLAIETIPDIFRTLGNVTADLAVMKLAGGNRQQRAT